MSNDPDFEKRFNNAITTIVENQARITEVLARITERQNRSDEQIGAVREAVAGLIQVARVQDERLGRIEKQTEENAQQIAALVGQGKETRETLNALIRIVEGHVSNHP